MGSSEKYLEIDYLAIDQTSELDLIIREKFSRLKRVCKYIQKCQVRVANTVLSDQSLTNSAYLVSINITMPEGFDLYTLRSPQDNNYDSVEEAIADVFAMIYRKLIELKLNRF